MIDDSVTRRSVLRSVAAAGAATAATGMVAGKEGPADRIVGMDSPRAERAAKAKAESVKRVLDFGDVGRAIAGRFTDEAAENLSRRPDVRYVEGDGTMEALAEELPWGIDRVDAEVAHASGETGGDDTDGEGGADIAIIDTGIDSDHPDLQTNLGTGYAVVSARGPYAESWDDDNGHGTHCAGIADAVDNGEGVVGVSTEATLHAVKVLDDGGSGSFSDIAEGIRWVADRGYDVGSMSLGASSGSSAVRDACQYAERNGVLLVAAAGNSGPCTDCVGYPAAYSGVIAVSSTTESDSLSDFSSTGMEVELAAPGSNIYSTYAGGGYDTFSGTSMACPHVSGAGGQLMDNGYSNIEARAQLKSTAEDIGLESNEQGSGLLDVEAAVSGSTDSAPSVSWENPSDGETVSGTVTVQIDASDSEESDDSLDVTYNVDGGSSRSTSYNTSGYYEGSWTTTGVSNGDHTLEANVTDSAGNTSSSSITVTTDNTESTLAVSTGDATNVVTDSATLNGSLDDMGGADSVDVYFEWGPSGDLSNTTSAQTLSSNGSFSADISGVSSDTTYDFRAVADASDGDSDTGSTNSFTTDTESTNSEPSASIDSVSDQSNPAWDRFTVDWSATDPDGNLDTVVVELLDSGGNGLDSVTNDIGGSSASGSDEVRSRSNATKVRVTATDTEGASGSDSQSV